MPSSAGTLADGVQRDNPRRDSSLRDNPLRDGMLHLEELPLAQSRSAAYQIVRDAGPVVRDAHGAYLVSDAEAVSYVLRHPDLFSSKRAFDSLGSPFPIVPVASDPPEHTRYRQLLRPFFGARGTARWLPEVRSLAAGLIDGFVERGQCDLVADFAIPLPAQVFLTLFGLPQEDRDRLIAWKEAVLGAVGISGAEPPSDSSIALAAELYEYRGREPGSGRARGSRCGGIPPPGRPSRVRRRPARMSGRAPGRAGDADCPGGMAPQDPRLRAGTGSRNGGGLAGRADRPRPPSARLRSSDQRRTEPRSHD